MAYPDSNPDKGLPTPDDMADFLGDFDGDFKSLFANSAINPIRETVISPSETSHSLGKKDPIREYMKDFFSRPIRISVLRAMEPREVAKYLNKEYNDYQTRKIANLAPTDKLGPEIAKITLKDEADYAEEQSKEWYKTVARTAADSPDYNEARKQSDYWHDMVEFIRPACDPDKTY